MQVLEDVGIGTVGRSKPFLISLEKNGLIEAVEKPIFKNRTFKFNESPMYRDDFGRMSFYSDVEHNKFPHSNSNS